jgi:hypothetical protein
MVGFIAAVIVSAVTFLGTQVAAALSSVIGGLLKAGHGWQQYAAARVRWPSHLGRGGQRECFGVCAARRELA